MPGLVPGIHVLTRCKDVDGRDEPGPPGEQHIDYTGMDITEGGSAIPYWMEDPFIAKEYTETLKRNGTVNRMDPQFYDKNYKGELPKE